MHITDSFLEFFCWGAIELSLDFLGEIALELYHCSDIQEDWWCLSEIPAENNTLAFTP